MKFGRGLVQNKFDREHFHNVFQHVFFLSFLKTNDGKIPLMTEFSEIITNSLFKAGLLSAMLP